MGLHPLCVGWTGFEGAAVGGASPPPDAGAFRGDAAEATAPFMVQNAGLGVGLVGRGAVTALRALPGRGVIAVRTSDAGFAASPAVAVFTTIAVLPGAAGATAAAFRLAGAPEGAMVAAVMGALRAV